ncbi:hypothetical protein [Rhodococcus sp. O3]|uniref:hypothetical protein n=1 Tax=Rhodococcus sp. O3 TaxID=3404919 RepID=UPI003B67295C
MEERLDVHTRSPDELQGQLLLALLHREMDEVTHKVETLERASHREAVASPSEERIRRSLMETLGELHRQIESIRTRFPSLDTK